MEPPGEGARQSRHYRFPCAGHSVSTFSVAKRATAYSRQRKCSMCCSPGISGHPPQPTDACRCARLGLTIVGILEPALGIIGGSMAALRPLRKYLRFFGDKSSGARSTSAPRPAYKMDFLARWSRPNTVIQHVRDPPYQAVRILDTESETYILKDSTAVLHME